ncbi:FAD-dependent oxidoreductase [Streptomyces sp. NPDC096040]|uniref:FAD-dependent oxidoreductase n=1 Tax=Streptomyces sp. NPDC096040 TaxID=3155541 RepID=UPI00332B367A
MRIAVIGAGPAGLTSAKQALAAGHRVVLYERTDTVGGIWNPDSGGAYDGVRMQSSRMSFPYSDFAPGFGTDFATRGELHGYLRDYARRSGALETIRFGHTVTEVVKRDGAWQVTADSLRGPATDAFDAVMVASGELWEPRRPAFVPDASTGVRVLTAKDYRRPQDLAGRRVLVVGGGVSGADIAAELAAHGTSVDWSVRRRALFLPRWCGDHYNDALLSYIGRVAVEELSYQDYLKWLESLLPEYFAQYRATGLLPESGFHGAVHVNDRIVPAVHSGAVTVVPAFERFEEDGRVVLTDGFEGRYDTVLLCMGYGMPNYDFVPELRREELYEHFFHLPDPTLAVINTPVDTEAFGTACPYFEAIAGWALRVFTGEAVLPPLAERADWCARHMDRLTDRRYYDCWLETVRIGLAAGTLPDPERDFTAYWRIVSHQVDPAGLRPDGPEPRPAAHDHALFDPAALKHRVLAALPAGARAGLLACGQITAEEAGAAERVPPGRRIGPELPYRQREAADEVFAGAAPRGRG